MYVASYNIPTPHYGSIILNRDDSSKDGDAGDSCRSSSNWRRLRSSRADHRSTLLTDCSAVLATAVESSPAIYSAWERTQGVSDYRSSLHNTKWREQIRSPAAGCQADPSPFTLRTAAIHRCLRLLSFENG